MPNALFYIPLAGEGGVTSITTAGSTYAQKGTNISLPFQGIRLFNGFSPLDLAQLQAKVNALVPHAQGDISLSLSQLRSQTEGDATLLYRLYDADPSHPFVYDAADTTSEDDTGTIVVTANGLRFKRLIVDYVDMLWYGVDGKFPGIQAAVDISLTVRMVQQLMGARGITSFLRLRAGNYRWDTTLVTFPYRLDLRCIDGEATLHATTDQTLIWYTTQKCHTEGIVFNGPGNIPVLINGVVSVDPDDYSPYSTVRVSQTSTFERCQFVNGRGHGCFIDGNVAYRTPIFPTGSNASLSVFRYCFFGFNGDCGYYIDRNSGSLDANQIEFYNCDCRDNKGWGRWDGSFLGCQILMGHNNANGKGHTIVSNDNNIATITSMYEEDYGGSDYLPSRFKGKCLVTGSRLTLGGIFEGQANFIEGRTHRAVQSGTIAVQYGGVGLTIQGPGNYSGLVRQEIQNKPNKTHVFYLAGTGVQPFAEYYEEGIDLQYPGAGSYSRYAETPGFAFPRLTLGTRYTTMDFGQLADFANKNFRPGDVVYNNTYTGTGPVSWHCYGGGRFSDGGTQINGMTGTVDPNNRAVINVSTNPSALRKDEYITFGGQNLRLLFDGDATNNRIVVDGYLPDNNGPVLRASPLFKALTPA